MAAVDLHLVLMVVPLHRTARLPEPHAGNSYARSAQRNIAISPLPQCDPAVRTHRTPGLDHSAGKEIVDFDGIDRIPVGILDLEDKHPARLEKGIPQVDMLSLRHVKRLGQVVPIPLKLSLQAIRTLGNPTKIERVDPRLFIQIQTIAILVILF